MIKACSRPIRPALTQHDESEYFFEGQVIGYAKTEMVSGPEKGSDTWGLKIVATKSIYTPSSIDTVEVYGFNQLRCRWSIPKSLDELEERSLVGKSVKVLAAPYEVPQGTESAPMRLQTGSGFSFRGVFTEIDQTMRYGSSRYNPIRMKEVLFLIATARTTQVEMRIQLLADAREYYGGEQQYWNSPAREQEHVRDLEFLRKEVTLIEDLAYRTILRQYRTTEKEKALLAEELERRSLPGIPDYLDSEEGKSMIKEIFGK